MRNIHSVLISTALCFALSACGGGGSEGSSNASNSVSSASLDSNNQTVASQDVSSMALGLFDTSSSVFGVDSPKESLLYTEAFSHLDKLPTYVTDASANPIVAGAVATQDYPCQSGSYTASVDDADNNSIASKGDIFSITYNRCVSGGVTLSGTLRFTITALLGTYRATAYDLGLTMSFGNFSANSGAYSSALNGAFSVSASKTGTNVFTQTISASSLSASASYQGVTRSRSLSGFSATETRTADRTYGYITSYMMSGTLSSSGFSGTRSVSFTTPTTFQRLGGATYPYTGVMLIKGASNSALKMTTVSNTQVKLELDANGDSIFESNSTVNWNTLI